jgi:hypothetical protein
VRITNQTLFHIIVNMEWGPYNISILSINLLYKRMQAIIAEFFDKL